MWPSPAAVWALLRASHETWVIFTIVTLNSVGWSASMPFLAVYLSAVRQVPLSTIGVVYFIAGMLSIASQIVGGRFTDSVGPRKVMLLGYVFSVASALVLSYLIGAAADTELIFIAYPAFNFLRGIAQPAAAAVVANSEISDLRTGLSLLSVAGNLGFAVGPALGGILAQSFDYASVFLFSAAVPAVTALIAARFVKAGLLTQPGVERRGTASAALRWKSDRNLILFLLLTLRGPALGRRQESDTLPAAGGLRIPRHRLRDSPCLALRAEVPQLLF
jgi:predicted MFS family arabinose efflux permease